MLLPPPFTPCVQPPDQRMCQCMQMARYAKHEALTTSIFVGTWSAGACVLLSESFMKPCQRLAVFMLSWFTTRVFMFPVFVIRSTLFESMVISHPILHALCTPVPAPLWIAVHLGEPQARANDLGVHIQPHHAILNGFLIFLYCLHVYW